MNFIIGIERFSALGWLLTTLAVLLMKILFVKFCFPHFFSLAFVIGHHKGHHRDHGHDSAVSSVSIVSEGTIDLDEVITTFLEAKILNASLFIIDD